MSSKHLSSLSASIVLSLLALAIFWFLPACYQDMPTGPTNPEIPRMPAPTPPAEIAQPVSPPVTPDLLCSAWSEAGEYVVSCDNGLRFPAQVYAVVYELVGGNEQHRFDMNSVVIESGKRGRVSARWPDCGKAQGDATADHEPPLVYYFPDRLPGYITGSTSGVVDLGDCPEECVPTSCPEDFGFDFELCRCDCVLERCSDPYVLDEDLCSCVCPITECPAGWTLENCECVACPPVGEPECPEQVWDYDLCEWTGECPGDCCDYVQILGLPLNFYHSPFGPPASECAEFGMVVGSGGIKIRKGGNCYEVTSECSVTALTWPPKVCCVTPQHGWKCFDQSHVTHCVCEEE